MNEDTDDSDNEEVADVETKYHYCWIKNLSRLFYEQNQQKCKRPLPIRFH